MIRQLLVGFAGIGITWVGSLVVLLATPAAVAVIGGGVLIVVGCSVLTWAVGAE